MSNPFEDLAEAQIAKPVKRQRAATAKRRATLASKKQAALDEKAALYRNHSLLKDADRDRVLIKNRHGVELVELCHALDRLGINDSNLLVAHIADQTWIAKADAEARFWALHLIAERISEIRKGAGLVEFDDPLPPHLNTFLRCRAIIRDAGHADLG